MLAVLDVVLLFAPLRGYCFVVLNARRALRGGGASGCLSSPGLFTWALSGEKKLLLRIKAKPLPY
jgi:hypothetical protein